VTGVESVADGGYRRTLRLPQEPATVALEPRSGHVLATLRLGDPRDLGPAVARLRRLLDLDADPVAVERRAGCRPGAAPSVAAVPGIRLPGTVDGAETALRTVLGQQVSVAAARTAASGWSPRSVSRCPRRWPGTGPGLLFPTRR
jgi:AraC family transcriptional regulator of adaptative response / DNA-3-methyladenine glycosylase II